MSYELELTDKEAIALVQLLRHVGGDGEARNAFGDMLRALEDAHVPVYRHIKFRFPHQAIDIEPYPSASLYAFGDIVP